MATGSTIFVTYMFESSPISGATNQPFEIGESYGYSSAIHCNYIQKVETNEIANKSVSLIMPNGSSFPFLRDSAAIQPGQDGTGWTAKKLYMLAQIVSGQTGSTVQPVANNWRIIDVTPQLDSYMYWSGGTIPAGSFDADTIINVSTSKILSAEVYNLDFLNYPSQLTVDDNKLAFGEEAFFFGNVNTEIKAIAYTTDISMVLPLNQYNSTTNPTWNSLVPVQISEAGLFNDNGDLLAVGKFNYSVEKNSSIYRTIQFSFDF